MTNQPTHWLAEQNQRQRQLLLIIDPTSAPDAVGALFKRVPIRDYLQVFQNTEFENLLEQSPWLIRIDNAAIPGLMQLLQSPELNWGWVASVGQLDLNEMALHWRERMVFREGDQRWFYRFQDNRVISRSLSALDPLQIPLLLGPIVSALCWDGKHWQSFENNAPAHYPSPSAKPWLDAPEPKSISDAIEIRALESWLWSHQPALTYRLQAPVKVWIRQQLDLAAELGWTDTEHVLFLVECRLNPNLAEHPVWLKREDESPTQHFARAKREMPQILANTPQQPHPPTYDTVVP